MEGFYVIRKSRNPPEKRIPPPLYVAAMEKEARQKTLKHSPYVWSILDVLFEVFSTDAQIFFRASSHGIYSPVE